MSDHWIDRYAESTAPKAPAAMASDAVPEDMMASDAVPEDQVYDVSEYAPPADESRGQKLKRLFTSSVKEAKQTPGDITPTVRGATLDPALSAVTGVGSSILGGLAGAAAVPVRTAYGLMTGESVPQALSSGMEVGSKTVRKIQDVGTYQPKGTAGKLVNELMGTPLSLASEVGGNVAGSLGANVGPKTEAAFRTVGEAAPEAAAAMLGYRGAKSAIKDTKTPLLPRSKREESAIRAQDLGYVLPVSEADPTLLNRFITGYGGKLQTQQSASIKNQPVTNSLAKKAVGVSEGVDLSYDVLKAVREKAGKSYQAVKDSKEPIYSNNQYVKAIDDLSQDWNAAERDFPELAKNRSEIGDLQTMMKKAYVSPTGAIEMVKNLRGDATANLKNFTDNQKVALGRAQRKAANALDQLIEDNLQHSAVTEAQAALPVGNPLRGMTPEEVLKLDAKTLPPEITNHPKMKLVNEYKKARQVIAKTHDIEAALNDSTGNVNAVYLGKILQKGKLSGELKDIAEFASSFKKAAQTPEAIGAHPGISPLDVAVAGIEGGTALAAGKPGLAAGLVGATLGRPAVRAFGLSDLYQKSGGAARRFGVNRGKIAAKATPLGMAGSQSAQEGQE